MVLLPRFLIFQNTEQAVGHKQQKNERHLEEFVLTHEFTVTLTAQVSTYLCLQKQICQCFFQVIPDQTGVKILDLLS